VAEKLINTVTPFKDKRGHRKAVQREPLAMLLSAHQFLTSKIQKVAMDGWKHQCPRIHLN